MRSATGPALGRRALLGAAAASAFAVVSGCTSSAGGDAAGGERSASSGTTPTTPAGTTGSSWIIGLSSGDLARVGAAHVDEAAALQRCRHIVRRYPRLADQERTFEAVLGAHVSAFATMLPAGQGASMGEVGTVPGSVAAARAEIVGSATQLAQHRTRDCHEADSGALAAVFAAAAAAHHAVVTQWAAS